MAKAKSIPAALQQYDEMTALYPQKVILTAARECGHNGKDAGEVVKLLKSWKDKGLETAREVEDYVNTFHEQTVLIRKLKNLWGTDETRIGKTDRGLIAKWTNEFGFSPEAITAAAPYAAEAKQPMTYLDKILSDYSGEGILTPEQIRQAHEKYKAGNKGKAQKSNACAEFSATILSGCAGADDAGSGERSSVLYGGKRRRIRCVRIC